jgi:hypothetical protein
LCLINDLEKSVKTGKPKAQRRLHITKQKATTSRSLEKDNEDEDEDIENRPPEIFFLPTNPDVTAKPAKLLLEHRRQLNTQVVFDRNGSLKMLVDRLRRHFRGRSKTYSKV